MSKAASQTSSAARSSDDPKKAAMTDEEKALVKVAMDQPYERKVERALGLLRLYERKATELDPEGYRVCFSGGKDSCVIKELCRRAGVRFKAHFDNTGIEAPELYDFLRRHHPDVEWTQPTKCFFPLMETNGPPTRLQRWCCKLLKHNNGSGSFRVLGVRAQESPRRARLWKEFSAKLDDVFLAPILYWKDEDVWRFIRENGIPYCSLYDHGYKRIGCLGCPMKHGAKRQADFDRYPRFLAAYQRAARVYYERTKEKRLAKGLPVKPTFESFWSWWMENEEPEPACVYEQMREQADGGGDE